MISLINPLQQLNIWVNTQLNFVLNCASIFAVSAAVASSSSSAALAIPASSAALDNAASSASSAEGCQGSRRKINAFVSSPDWFGYLLHMPTNGSRMLLASKKHNFSELSSVQGFSGENPGEIREKSRIARGLCGFGNLGTLAS